MTMPAPSIRQTREQLFAARTHRQILSALADYERRPAELKQYRSMILSAPALVHNAGLAQALAFITSRDKEKAAAQRRLADDLAKTVLGDQATGEELLNQACGAGGELRDYLYLARQVLEALVWFRRYAQILIPDDMPAPKEPRA